ncbi:FAD-dependent monooxygenase [Streptomyces boncukensis]|uniref:Monooxygenase n=1 Tax=Streptomyces boncukensis TaxID=2711219 RepID=A0A6G4WYA5_9ACTN|nr:FAD-dependent monooxygenase [Streptomyces boncukensis]NGO69421.1 monooxygenase [Streptomyces boncukensis]
MRQIPVLVVGGSLTGLSAAVFLTLHGIPVTVVERRRSVLPHPRLQGITPRSVELYRQAGLEPGILARCPRSAPAARLVSVRARTLADEHEALGDPGTAGEHGAAGPLSPCAFAPLGQDELETLLVERLREQECDLRQGTELTGFAQDRDGVRAHLRGPDGRNEAVCARYLIAADGASSGVRRRLGIASHGPGALFHMATMHVRADLTPALRGRDIGMAYLERPAAGTTLGPLDSTGLHWFFATAVADGQPMDPVAWLRAATGVPSLDVRLLEQIPGTRQIFTFPVGARVAERYGAGRVFLAGDAAHLMPPTGTLGGHTGIEDAHNLAWKLALVLRGTADRALLTTYDEERRPVAERNMRQSYLRGRARWRLAGYADDEPPADLDTLMFGSSYRSPAVPGAPDDGQLLEPAGELQGAPGTRAPHVHVVQDGAPPVSTLDLYGTDFVVLVGPRGDGWAEAAHRAGRALAAPVDVYHLDQELAAPHGLGPEGALLVRPDGHVAWRAPHGADDADARFAQALRAVLARPAPRS